MAAAKKRRGLGRGLDALIPVAEPEEQQTEEDGASREESRTEPVREETAQSGKTAESDAGKIKGQEDVRVVKLSKVEPNRSQPRKNFDQEKLQELADSIQAKGLLEPILVQDRGNHFEIIAGERRWRACRLAGLKEIPVIVRSYDELEQVEISLIENIQRENLNPIEEAIAYQRLSAEFHLTQEEIAQRVSKNRASVANTMRLLRLAEPVQQMVMEGRLSMGHARALISVEDVQAQEELAKEIVDQDLSVREVEKLVRRREEESKNQKKDREDPAKEKDSSMDVFYRDIADRMKESLGMKVTIRQQGEDGGKIEIIFSGREELEKLMDLLMAE